MNEEWVKEAFEAALMVIDNGELVKAAGEHVLVEGVWTPRKIRPSLITSECDLQQVKQYRGHQPQPGASWQASRRGMPDPATNATFARGFLGEGFVVAVLTKYAEMTNDYMVIANAPTFVAEAEPDYEGHPDVLVIGPTGETELIQVKTPSVWSYQRYLRGDQNAIMDRYRAQVVCEMFICRMMGIEVARSHLFSWTWEVGIPGTQMDGHIPCIDIPLEWDDRFIPYIEALADKIRANDYNATQDIWPKPALPEENYNKWPCSYCQFARTRLYEGQVICTEVDQWEKALPPAIVSEQPKLEPKSETPPDQAPESTLSGSWSIEQMGGTTDTSLTRNDSPPSEPEGESESTEGEPEDTWTGARWSTAPRIASTPSRSSRRSRKTNSPPPSET